MGGHAFTANDPSGLSTPRMPPNIYFMLKDHYLQLLSSVYTQIATPIEAPKKLSYGDIDILVSQPKSPPISAEFLAELLAAERVFKVSGSAVTSFALPYPNLPKTYVQLDLHLSPPKIFHWQLFHQSHGDCELCLSSPSFLIRITCGVARHVAEVKSSWDMFHDSDLIPEEIC